MTHTKDSSFFSHATHACIVAHDNTPKLKTTLVDPWYQNPTPNTRLHYIGITGHTCQATPDRSIGCAARVQVQMLPGPGRDTPSLPKLRHSDASESGTLSFGSTWRYWSRGLSAHYQLRPR